jgi:hypothetical protein
MLMRKMGEIEIMDNQFNRNQHGILKSHQKLIKDINISGSDIETSSMDSDTKFNQILRLIPENLRIYAS